MKRSHLISTVLSVALCCISCSFSDRFNATGEDDGKAIADEFAFNGYTNHWQNIYRQHYRYGNLYRINIPDLDKTIAQSRRDLADKLGIPGLEMQEGFFFRLAGAPYMVLDNPTESELKAAFRKCDNILVYADRDSETGMQLACKAPAAASLTGSYQTKADDFHTLDAFMLKNRKKTLFAVIGCRDDRETFKEALGYAEKVTGEYEMKRGWFGTGTNIQSVTCTPGTPVDVMGAGMNEGNSWFVFSGSYETFRELQGLGDWYIGIGGVLTYKKASIAETVRRIPLGRILLETDSPYLTPVPFRGKRNESSYIPHIAARLAGLTETDIAEVAAITTDNARKLFGI